MSDQDDTSYPRALILIGAPARDAWTTPQGALALSSGAPRKTVPSVPAWPTVIPPLVGTGMGSALDSPTLGRAESDPGRNHSGRQGASRRVSAS